MSKTYRGKDRARLLKKQIPERYRGKNVQNQKGFVTEPDEWVNIRIRHC